MGKIVPFKMQRGYVYVEFDIPRHKNAEQYISDRAMEVFDALELDADAFIEFDFVEEAGELNS